MQSDFRRSAGPRCLAAGPATGSPAALTPSISAVRARFVPGPVDRPCRCQVAGFRKALNILVPRPVSKEGLLGSRIRENAGDVARILTNAATPKSKLDDALGRSLPRLGDCNNDHQLIALAPRGLERTGFTALIPRLDDSKVSCRPLRRMRN